MLIAQEFELAHPARKLTSTLQSPAEVSAQLRQQDVSEEALAASGPEIPPRLDASLRDARGSDYRRPEQREEVDAILHTTSLAAGTERKAAVRTKNAP